MYVCIIINVILSFEKNNCVLVYPKVTHVYTILFYINDTIFRLLSY